MNQERENKGKYMNSMRYVKTGVLVLLFTVVSVGLLLPGMAFAEEGYGPGTDKWKFALGGYFPAIKTELKMDGSEVGDNLDLHMLLNTRRSDRIRFHPQEPGW